jgi:hypothetical protein
MPIIFRKSDPTAAAGASPDPAANTTSTPKRKDQRWFSLRGGERAQQFALSLKANARWMRRFLHGGN